MSHSWFINFDKKFNFQFPLQFLKWWTQFGHVLEIFHDKLNGAIKYLTSVYKSMFYYRWYQNVFISRVMLWENSLKPYWKDKFIDRLLHLFAHKVKDELTNATVLINYDNFTYDDIISTIKKFGISMCNDIKKYYNNN